MKTRNYSFILAFGAIPLSGIAQLETPNKDTIKPAPVAIIATVPPAPDTSIHLILQPVVKNAIQKVYDYQRYTHGASPGFRVQINFGQERNAITETKSEFSDKYPTVPAYITYKQPYFRLSVGDCRTRLQAVRLLNSLKKDYPAAFIVADKIVPPPI